MLAFDQDEKADTRRQVITALFRFGALLEASGSTVSIATWNGRDGKGVDDLIVKAGAAAWELFGSSSASATLALADSAAAGRSPYLGTYAQPECC